MARLIPAVLSLLLPLAIAAPASADCGCEHKVKVKKVKCAKVKEVKCKPVKVACHRERRCGCERTVAVRVRPACGCGSTDWGTSVVTTTDRVFRPVTRVVTYPFRSHHSRDVVVDDGGTYRTVSYERPIDMD